MSTEFRRIPIPLRLLLAASIGISGSFGSASIAETQETLNVVRVEGWIRALGDINVGEITSIGSTKGIPDQLIEGSWSIVQRNVDWVELSRHPFNPLWEEGAASFTLFLSPVRGVTCIHLENPALEELDWKPTTYPTT